MSVKTPDEFLELLKEGKTLEYLWGAGEYQTLKKNLKYTAFTFSMNVDGDWMVIWNDSWREVLLGDFRVKRDLLEELERKELHYRSSNCANANYILLSENLREGITKELLSAYLSATEFSKVPFIMWFPVLFISNKDDVLEVV